MERYRLTEMPGESVLRRIVLGLTQPPPSIIFNKNDGRFEKTREVPETELPEIKEMPDQAMLEAFINGEAFFNVATGAFELKR